MKRGLYRVRGIQNLPDDVRLDDDGIEVPIEERLYRNRGYMPLVADLLWQEDYMARKASGSLPLNHALPNGVAGVRSGSLTWGDKEAVRGAARRSFR